MTSLMEEYSPIILEGKKIWSCGNTSKINFSSSSRYFFKGGERKGGRREVEVSGEMFGYWVLFCFVCFVPI